MAFPGFRSGISIDEGSSEHANHRSCAKEMIAHYGTIFVYSIPAKKMNIFKPFAQREQQHCMVLKAIMGLVERNG